MMETQEPQNANTPQATKKPRRVRSIKHKKTKRRLDNMDHHIAQLVKKVAPNHGLSAKAVRVLNDFATQTLERLLDECRELVKVTRTQTLTSRDLDAAAKLLWTSAGNSSVSDFARKHANAAVKGACRPL